MSTEQALAFRSEQLSAMPSFLFDAILARRNSTVSPPPYPPPSSGNWSYQYNETHQHYYGSTNSTTVPPSTHPPTTRNNNATTSSPEAFTEDPGSIVANTQNANVEVTSSISDVTRPESENIGRKSTNSDRSSQLPDGWKSSTPRLNSDGNLHNVRSSLQPPSDVGWSGGSVRDAFDQQRSLIDSIMATVPDSITSQNVDQFVDVLPFLPAADIASKLDPPAVS